MNVFGWIVVTVLILIVVLMIFGVLISPWMKGQYKKDAYRLLKTSNPSLKRVKETIKGLNEYVGRWSKDEEAKELLKRLMDKLEIIE